MALWKEGLHELRLFILDEVGDKPCVEEQHRRDCS